MSYKIKLWADTSLRLIEPRRWWWDTLSTKDVIAALTEISQDARVISVTNIGSSLSPRYIVITVPKTV